MLLMLFAENLFHFKLDQREYSIAPGDYSRLPLFHDNKCHKTLLNKFFFYVFFKVSSWQSMRDIHVTSLEELTELMLHSPARYAELPLSRSGPAMPEVPVVSRNMIAYLISLLTVAPFYPSLDLLYWPSGSSQGPTSPLLSVLQPWPMPSTKTSVPMCTARLLDGTGCFLPSGAPKVQTRRTSALMSRS